MKRFLIILMVVLFIPITAVAQQDELSAGYEDALSDYDLSFFRDTLDDDAYRLLEELGLDGFRYESIYSLSLNDALSVLRQTVRAHFKTPLEGMTAVLIFILLSALFQSMKSESSEMNSLYSTVSALVIASILVIKVSPCLTLAGTSMKVASDFVYAFIPVFAAIVAASGGITTAFSTNSLLLVLSQALSYLASNVFFPLINCFLAIGICSGLRAELNLDRIVTSLKQLITSGLSLLAGLFISVLSMKTTVAAKADALGVRGLRFVITSVVPVVGPAISEGLISIQSYSSMIKTGVGTIGIIAVLLVFLPPIVYVALWRMVLTLSLIAADIFDDKSVRLTLTVFKDALLLMQVVLIVSLLTTVISIGILVASHTGGA